MLNIIFQKAKAKDQDKIIIDSRIFFSVNKKKEWFSDKFVQLIMEKVDRVKVIRDFVLEDEDGNAIPPEYLSTGAKTAICIYKFPDMIFNLTQMGDNALVYALAVSKVTDITALCYRFLPYNLLMKVGFNKDYEPYNLSDPLEFPEDMRQWLEEESIND